MIANCPVLERKSNPKTVGLISGGFCSKPNGNTSDGVIHPDKTGNGLFLHSGTVSVPRQGKPVPVRIIRDTGAALSFILEEVLPLSEQTATGSAALICGFEMGNYGGCITSSSLEI